MSIGKKKNIFIMGGLFFLIGTLCLVLLCDFYFKNSSTIDKNQELYQTSVDKNLFGMYVEDENGEYVEYTDSSYFPIDYNFNAEKSYCVNKNDQLLDGVLVYENGKVTVTSNTTTFCYLYFDEDDVTITVSTDGASNTIPTSGIYKISTSCSSGNAYYNPYYQRLEIGGFKRGTKCTLDYTKDTTSYTLLSSVVQSNTTTNANGYRYSGTNPDNYVWFNNEMWRIIGLIPVCTTASNGTCSNRTTSLVKIIKAESIGALAYDAKSSGYTSLWGNNTLFTLLNTYYYGKQNGTETSYCFTSSASGKGKCDYTTIGISSSSTDYYGRMVESVYWNIGLSSNQGVTPGTIYGTESATVTTNQAKIGLMSTSDYGYAATVSGYGTYLAVYNTAAITGTNWLYGYGDEWTNIQYDTTSVMDVKYDGDVTASSPNMGKSVRPVLYLDAGVYKISGSGKMLDPYVIGM